jgi:lipopolysaccharide transport system ATP-binding protein
MSSDIAAIEIAGLAKSYRIGAAAPSHRSFGEALGEILRRPFASDRAPELWALRDVNLSVNEGEVLGLIGKNGSGKSTLLKILARVTAPTRGEVRLHGRVASLLEVGTGFHPELTGRENIFLSGEILGMRRSEIRAHFDEIVEFSGVSHLLDTPVKRYSSGQYTRLAFAIAGFLQPEILLVDEVLAVGDAEFQRKCLGRMREVARSQRTVLFVSHNMDAVASLCSRAIQLSEGRVVADGDASAVTIGYLSRLGVERVIRWRGEAGDETVRLVATELSADGGVLATHRAIRIRVALEISRPVLGLICAVEVVTRDERMLAYSAFDDALPPPPDEVSPGVLACEVVIPPNSLAAGVYEVRFDVGIHNVRRIVEGVGSLSFELPNPTGIGRRYLAERATGLFRPDWQWRRLDASERTAFLQDGTPS